MSDPYLVLGIKPTASDEEVKRAYRDLVKKYHPDSYQNNPLFDLAEEKMKEVNEAYDTIVKQRSSAQQSYGGPHGTYAGRQSASGGSFQQVRRLLDQGSLNEAHNLLEAMTQRNAEWHYLMGSLAYRRGWLAEARDNFAMACNMEPTNQEYRQAAEYLNTQSNRGFQSYQRGGFSLGDLCCMSICLNGMCDCC